MRRWVILVMTLVLCMIPAAALDGEKLDGVAMIEKLNKLGGENGIGLAINDRIRRASHD